MSEPGRTNLINAEYLQELNSDEIELVSGGETDVQRETIGTAIILGGLATADPVIIALGVLYLNTN